MILNYSRVARESGGLETPQLTSIGGNLKARRVDDQGLHPLPFYQCVWVYMSSLGE